LIVITSGLIAILIADADALEVLAK